MITRPTLPLALRAGATLPAFLDSGDSKVTYDWDFRGASLIAGWSENGTGHQYSETDGVNCGVAGSISLANLVDTDLIGEGTILIEYERAALAFDSETYDPTFQDAIGRTDAGEHYLFSINENGGFLREILVAHSAGINGSCQITCEGATDDPQQPVRLFDRKPPDDDTFDDRWAIAALTWKSGRIYVIIDGCIEASFQREIIDDDINDISLAARGSAYLGDYWIKRAQVLNVCVAPKITAPKIALIADSFCVRYTGRKDTTLEDLPSYLEQQGSLSYIYSQPDVLATSRHTELVAPNWAQTNTFTYLQSIASSKYGIWPPLFNAGRNGAQWRSDLGNQINSAQTDAIIDYDPEILWCFGSVNDIQIGDLVEDIEVDIKALLTTMITGCRNVRKVYFVETFSTPETRADEDIADTYIEDARLRAKLALLDGYTVANAKGIDVSVEFIETWSQWASDGVVSARYGIGSHPDNGTSSAQGPGDTGDVHPTSEGSAKIAEILKPYFLNDLIVR